MDLLNPEIGLFFWSLLAFLLVLFLLKKFAWKPILAALHEREKGIADAISSAERMRQEMGLIQAENEKLLAQAREERTQIIKEAREMQDKMIGEARDRARTEADKILADANEQIQRQKMAALTDVKNQIGKLSVEVAEKILRQQLATAEAQNKLMVELTEDIRLN